MSNILNWVAPCSNLSTVKVLIKNPEEGTVCYVTGEEQIVVFKNGLWRYLSADKAAFQEKTYLEKKIEKFYY